MRATHYFCVGRILVGLDSCGLRRDGIGTCGCPAPARIIVLYDAFGKDATMTKGWGYAALVEISGKRILFDTGDDPGFSRRTPRPKVSTSRGLTSSSCHTATATTWADFRFSKA